MAKPLLGLFSNMSLQDYLNVDALSASGLKQLARSPWHFKNRVDIDQTPAMLRGTLAHCAILEPGAMATRYAVVPAGAPRKPTASQWSAKAPSAESAESMRWWAKFTADNNGREIVAPSDYAACQAQLKAIADEPYLAELLGSGHGELSIFWIDARTGLYCKARPDWLQQTLRGVKALDLKTCADESPSGFGRAAARLRYDLQAAHYTAGIEAVTNRKLDEFVFAAVSNKPPILAVPYVLTDEVFGNGRDERNELMERLEWCQRENQWPSYGTGVQLLDFPAYAKNGGEVEVEWSES